jgi:2'-5' RNA ligase
LETADSFKSQAQKIQDKLRPFKCRVSWTGISGLHLTLKFLGDTEESSIEGISLALKDITSKFSVMKIELTAPGVFGGNRPRVLWLGMHYPPELKELHHQIETALIQFGFPPEGREFHPHLTVGRIKDFSGTEEMVKYFKSLKIESLEYTANKLIFFRSELKTQGAVYTPLRIFTLPS